MAWSLAIILFLSVGLPLHGQSPSQVFTSANQLYIEGRFAEAAERYQQLVDSGYQSAELYFNLGNAYYQLAQIPKSILYYERAHRLAPGDEDIRFNLELARALTVDRIEPLPQLFLVEWYLALRGALSSNGWAKLSLALMAVTLGLALLFWFASRAGVKRSCFALALLFLALTALAATFSAQERDRLTRRDYAIVFDPAVTVRSSPSETGRGIFILHEGTRVRVTNALGEWVEIRIADGNKGWVQRQAIEVI